MGVSVPRPPITTYASSHKSLPRLNTLKEVSVAGSRTFSQNLASLHEPLQTFATYADLHTPRPSPTSAALQTASVRFRTLPYASVRFRRPPYASVRFRGPKGRAIEGNRFWLCAAALDTIV
ncbi:hypothetical protein F4803DRAFT_557992 [Xylaria telfairii]|nr:hypothetical protein F4803DRAFT_557992 [Xylaria telfairii]